MTKPLTTDERGMLRYTIATVSKAPPIQEQWWADICLRLLEEVERAESTGDRVSNILLSTADAHRRFWRLSEELQSFSSSLRAFGYVDCPDMDRTGSEGPCSYAIKELKHLRSLVDDLTVELGGRSVIPE